MKKHNDLFSANLIYFIIMVLLVAIRICTAMDVFSFLGNAQDLILTVIVQVGLMFVLPWLLFSKLNKKKPFETWEDFRFKGTSFKVVMISILIGIIVFILNIFVSTFFSYILSMFGYRTATSAGGEQTWGTFFLSLFSVAVLPAVCEEFTHRGMILSSYKKLGFKKAVLLSGLMFGLIHLNVGQFFYATIIGIILAVVTLYSQSLVPAIIIHFMNNAFNVYFDFAQSKGIFGAGFYTKISNLLVGGNIFTNLIFIIVILSLLILLLVFLISMLLKINAEKSVVKYAERQTLLAMRNEVLKDIRPEQPNIELNQSPIIFARNAMKNTMSVKIPYEILGFYMEPEIKPTLLDKVFFWAVIILGSLVTLSTFIWGIL